ncbi:MAG TPA: DUF2330 domain-containing protein [Thermoanaerobaculia bacterium]|nr:DUF2330 domain-containing protein [Thermoanaerobaculia bacterium]
MKKAVLFLVLLTVPGALQAFCGFYVAKADTKLFNKASQVAIVRDEQKTVLTMANDYQGSLKEFAIVVPVPTTLQRQQIHVGDKALLDHLDAYSSPRLVEYFDRDPCAPIVMYAPMAAGAMRMDKSEKKDARANSLGVTIEARYTVGEYDIIILSAKQSDGLQTWLVESGYKIPQGAQQILGSYIKQGMHFFVAKVNLTQQARLGYNYLRPLQMAFDSPKFMLPIRLGTLNANGTQELFVYMLTKNGRVESSNYRNAKLPSGMNVPLYVKQEFGPFYKAMFSEQVRKEEMSTVFQEYAWNMSWCDPCAAEPLSNEELRKLGVFWLSKNSDGGAPPVFLTRLHVRYDAAHFPEDLSFQQTSDTENYQARYVLNHPWTGSAQCQAAAAYRKTLNQRNEEEIRNLVTLTGWKGEGVRRKMNLPASNTSTKEDTWWEKLWD